MIRVFFLVISLVCLFSCQPMPGVSNDTDFFPGPPVAEPAYPALTPISNIDDPSIRSAVEAQITGKKYYVDGLLGDDETGQSDNPSKAYKTLEKVLPLCAPSDGVFLGDGVYNSLTYSAPAGKVTFINQPGKAPVVGPVTINNTQDITLWGLRILVPKVEQTLNPYLKQAGSETYNKTLSPVSISGSQGIRVFNCDLYGYNKYLTDYGVDTQDGTAGVEVSYCQITRLRRAINTVNTTNIKFTYNHTFGTSGSAVYIGGGCDVVWVEGNHIHDSNYEWTDAYCPRAYNQNYHGAGISLRCSNVTIRNNIIHDGFNSAGIFTYLEGGATFFDNVLIENNLIYDIRGHYAVRFEGVRNNFVLRNNLFVGHGKTSNDSAELFDTTVLLGSLAATAADASGMKFNNNVSVGKVNLAKFLPLGEFKNNITYVLNKYDPVTKRTLNMTQAEADTAGYNSKVICYQYNAPISVEAYFTSGFFQSTALTFAWDSDVNGDDLYSNGNGNPKGHHQTLDFSYTSGNDAVNFGDLTLSPSDVLGSLQPSGFIKKSTTTRSSANHNSGPW